MKKVLLISAILVLSVLLFACAEQAGKAFGRYRDTTSSGSSQDSAEQCVDSDSGQNFVVKGTITGPYPSANTGWAGTQTDNCDGNTLYEWYCNDNLKSLTPHDCTSDGKRCSDGACVLETQQPVQRDPGVSSTQGTVEHCVDSDGGQNFAVKGNITGPYPSANTGWAGTQTDNCDGSKVYEWYCNDNLKSLTPHDCAADGMVCSDGRCMASPSQSSATSSNDLPTAQMSPIEDTLLRRAGGQSKPDIYENKLVWIEEARDGRKYSWDIYLEDLSTKDIRRVSTDGKPKNGVKIYGDNIVYKYSGDLYLYKISSNTTKKIDTLPYDAELNGWDYNIHDNKVIYSKKTQSLTFGSFSGDTDLYVYDIDTEKTTPVAQDGSQTAKYQHTLEQTQPDIYGNLIAWEDSRNYDTTLTDVYLMDLSTGVETRLSSFGSYENNIDITDKYVVWRNIATSDLYIYNISTGTTKVLPNRKMDRDVYLSGDMLVWCDSRSGNWDIYLYDIAKGTETKLTGTQSQCESRIYGNTVVWWDNTYDSGDIYVKKLS